MLGPIQLGVVAGPNAEIIAAFDWAALDERLGEQPPRLSIGRPDCECPSRDDRDLMRNVDEQIDITPDQRFDPAIAAPPGRSYDLARTAVGLADAELYRAKHASSRSDDALLKSTCGSSTGG